MCYPYIWPYEASFVKIFSWNLVNLVLISKSINWLIFRSVSCKLLFGRLSIPSFFYSVHYYTMFEFTPKSASLKCFQNCGTNSKMTYFRMNWDFSSENLTAPVFKYFTEKVTLLCSHDLFGGVPIPLFTGTWGQSYETFLST